MLGLMSDYVYLDGRQLIGDFRKVVVFIYVEQVLKYFFFVVIEMVMDSF